jgi:6-pyruvoyltetrahydropterin/6-carboxytetrahydropterin synthase
MSFSAAHRYASPKLNEEENRAAFGSLYREDGFGHNFNLEAHFEGPVDSKSGMLVNLADVDRWIEEEISARLDHRFLNQLECFRDIVPTPENLALVCFDWLTQAVERSRAQNPHLKLVKVRIFEGPDVWADAVI